MNSKRAIGRGTLGVVALAAMLGFMPPAVHSADEPLILKVAIMVPRSGEAATQAAIYNRRLGELTNNTVGLRIYWGAAAGQDREVLRKMRAGQIDGSPFPLEIISTFVRQALVLGSPALFNNYRQVDAARAALTPQMDQEAYENGFKVMSWGDIGRLRIMTKKPIHRISDFKQVRPWLYAESEMLKELYKVIGASGVPLGLAEVYPGLATDMIDVVWGSALLAAALQWHTYTKYISAKGLGFISGAFVFRRGAWDALPPVVQESLNKIVKDQARQAQIDMRKSDELAYQKLVARGHIPLQAENEAEWWAMGANVRTRLIGRIYTKQLVEKAEAIVKQYRDPGSEH